MTHPECQDDSSIANKQRLFRRVLKHFVDDEGRIAAAAFEPSENDPEELHLSVDLEGIRPPEHLLGSLFGTDINFSKIEPHAQKQLIRRGHKVAAIKTGTVRCFDQKVFLDPENEYFKDGPKLNKAHTTICGQKEDELLQILVEEANQNIILSSP